MVGDIEREYEELLRKITEMPGIADLMRLNEWLQEEGRLLAQLRIEEYSTSKTSNRSF